MDQTRPVLNRLTARHFETDLARTVYNDLGLSSRLPQAVRVVLERRLIAWANSCSAAGAQIWGPRLDAALVPCLSPLAFRNFCAALITRHPQVLLSMHHSRNSCLALARAVHVSQHINPDVLGRLLNALADEGLK
jgi:hypothetical protein